MAYTPISNTVPQYMKDGDETASGYYLKGYTTGTTTPLSMGTDTTGSTTLAKCKLNASGYPISNDADETTVFVPHFNADYKLALYTNSTDADADTVANAVWVVDAFTAPTFSSDSFTADFSASFSGTVTTTVRWQQMGRLVTLFIENFTGTSDTTDFASGATDVPAAIRPATDTAAVMSVRDNSVTQLGTVRVTAAGQIDVSLYTDSGTTEIASSVWTGSNEKGIVHPAGGTGHQSITYRIS